jgi:hypothetical protein
LSFVENDDELWHHENEFTYWADERRRFKNPIREFIKYFPFVVLSEKDIDNITCIYILEKEPMGFANVFHGRGKPRFYISESKNTLLYFRVQNTSTWMEIVNAAHSEKLVLYLPELDKSITTELVKIPHENIDINIGKDFKTTKYSPLVIRFTNDFPEFKKKKDKEVNYQNDSILLNLFQMRNHISIPPESGYVMHLNTDDFALANFLISDLVGKREIFWTNDEGDLEELKKDYEVVVINNFDKIGYQRQNNFWLTLKGFGFENKPVFLVGKNSKVIPTIKHVSNFIETDPFDFKSIRVDVVKFLCNYLSKRKDYKGDFSKYLLIDESYIIKNIFFQATNFNILIEALDKNKPNNFLDLYDHHFLFRLLSDIEELNKTNKIDAGKSDNNKSLLGYIWKFRGNFWEISYNYTETILVRDVIGMFYLGSFMEKAGKESFITNIREEAGLNKDKASMSSLNSLRKQLDEAINIIKTIEEQLGLKKSLSIYLNQIVNSKKGFFKDEDYCTWPKDSDYTWEVFRPIKYFIKKRGANNPSGEKKIKKPISIKT